LGSKRFGVTSLTFQLSSRDFIGHVAIRFPYYNFPILVVLWKQASISNGFRDIQWRIWRNGWHDLK